MSNEIALCEWKDCRKPATHNFRWDWGQEGKCCQDCIALLNQTAVSLSRTVSTRPLDAAAGAAPVTRSERTTLIAAKLSAEAELEEVQKRGHQLYESNVDLTSQVQTLKMQAREHKSIVDDLNAEVDLLQEQLAKRE